MRDVGAYGLTAPFRRLVFDTARPKMKPSARECGAASQGRC
jgi:hypothetical protein